MKKRDFVAELARMTNMSNEKAWVITTAMLDILANKLAEKEKVQFFGFGSFYVRHSPMRMVRNPQTGESIMAPEKDRPVFKPSKKLLYQLNEHNGND